MPDRAPAACALGAGLDVGGLLALAQDHRDRRVDRHVLGAFGDQNLADRALVDRLDLHGRLVGLDLGDYVAGLDRVALALEPLGEIALLHRGRQRGHQHFNGHGRKTFCALCLSMIVVRDHAQRDKRDKLVASDIAAAAIITQ